MTKKALKKDNDRLYIEINECYDTIRRLSTEKKMVRRENKALTRICRAQSEEIDFLRGKIDRAIRYCECKRRERTGTPAWLREVMAE